MTDLRSKTITCHVSLPDDSVVFAVCVDKNAAGRDVLTKVCGDLHILEVDYFGLVHRGVKGEELWLNLRNRIASELSGCSPYCLQLRVKFFVEPHFIQQETTRDQFVLHVKQQFLSGKLRFAFDDETVDAAALLFVIQQRESAKSFRSSPGRDQFLPTGYQSAEYKNLVQNQSTKFATLSEDSAKRRFLEATSLSSFFGVRLHEARDKSGRVVQIGVGRDGLTEYEEDSKLCASYNWPMIQLVTHDDLDVVISIIQDKSDSVKRSLRLANKMAAGALYRDTIEMRSFFHCDTVDSLIKEQYCRDMKGAIASLFYENTCLGKSYVFDIQRTLHEAYDYVRRILYLAESGGRLAPSLVENSSASGSLLPDMHHRSSSPDCQASQRLSDACESLACRICADDDIDVAFVPCGHVVSCAACSQQLDCCPVCKTTIDLIQPVYLPYDRPMFTKTTSSKESAVART